jgi:hypothetical protein
MHVQHSTLAGGVAISAIADVNLQCYVALIIGSIAGMMSTVGFHAITVISLSFSFSVTVNITEKLFFKEIFLPYNSTT